MWVVLCTELHSNAVLWQLLVLFVDLYLFLAHFPELKISYEHFCKFLGGGFLDPAICALPERAL